ncbi:MAG: acetate CoA-transferase subunit alpha [Candidatus Zixiibacteriota bacterium]
MKKLVSKYEVKKLFKDGMSVMVGGFLGCGSPEELLDIMVEEGVKDLTVIGNDSGFPDVSIGKLVVAGLVKKVITSHIGTNPETGRQLNEGILEVDLVPQGTLVEQIRAAGSGLGGVLTPTGVGTVVEEGKKKLEIDGKEYLLELPIRADIAIIKGSKVDTEGNVFYAGTTRNFNPLMALAADIVIVEAEELVEAGEIAPENVVTPGVLVDYILKGEQK